MSFPDAPAPGRAVVFTVGDAGFRWDDVFAFARRRGDWEALEREVREAQACQRMAAARALPSTAEEERSAARQFRYAHRLHAAEELESWLAERGLTVAQWRDYLRGTVLRRRHARDLATIVDRYPPDENDLRTAVPVWGVCSGAFLRWAKALAARAAAAWAVWEGDGAAGVSPGADRLDTLGALAERFPGQAVTRDRLQAVVDARYLDWLRLECEEASFATEDAAREALLCVRDDGWSLADTARAAGTAPHRRSMLVEEVGAEHRHDFVRARGGDLVGPLRTPAGWMVVHVLGKTTPDLADEALRARAARELVDAAVAREVDDRVRWTGPR